LTLTGYAFAVTDVFTAKNLEKPDSTDLYIATEFAERYADYSRFAAVADVYTWFVSI